MEELQTTIREMDTELKEANNRIEFLEGVIETMQAQFDDFGDRANSLAHDLWTASKEEY